MESLIIIKYRHEGRLQGEPFGAYVQNTSTGKSFYLSSYSSEKKRDLLAPKLLAKKLANPSSEFKRFCNAKKQTS